jgi:CO dehydrogenase nickel-insertion accessory protein CooC1
MNETSQGQIITFYSYKGGTGRTMALANVAWILASNGKRVLSVDWDLESPGLHKFFHPFLDESTLSATPGVIEIINDYASAAVDPGTRSDDWHLEFAQVQRHAVSLEWVFPEGGRLDFLSAGRQNRDYSAAVCSLDWDNFYDRLGGGRFFRAMRADMKQNYDYVLIDSRTGLSDVADICTIELPDVLAICFTLSDQSIEGAANVARQISGRYRDRNIRVLPFPMRIEDGEKEKLDVGRALARMKFEGFPAGMTAESSALYWASVEVPYKPFYAFEETLATFGDDPGSPASLLASFERVTDSITDGDVTTMRPIAEDLRLQYKEAFARRQPAASTQVYVSYVPEDRMWRHARTAPRQARRWRPGRGGRPGAVWAWRRRQDPVGPGVRAPLHGRLRPGLVGALGAGGGDQCGAGGPGPQNGPEDRRQRGGSRGGRIGGVAP